MTKLLFGTNNRELSGDRMGPTCVYIVYMWCIYEIPTSSHHGLSFPLTHIQYHSRDGVMYCTCSLELPISVIGYQRTS